MRQPKAGDVYYYLINGNKCNNDYLYVIEKEDGLYFKRPAVCCDELLELCEYSIGNITEGWKLQNSTIIRQRLGIK